MNDDFEDIKIVAFDDKATRKGDPHLALRYLVLVLSASTTREWAQYFNECWRNHLYMEKRDAIVSGDRLEIYCVPDELEKHHIPELKKVISQTNQAYRQHLAEQQRAAAVRVARESEEQAKLAEIKSRLKFD